LVNRRKIVGFFDKCRAARATLTTPETIATLDHMEDFFGNGKNWTKGVYSAADGARCLVGAADYAKVSKVDDAKYWLRQAIAERSPHWTIEQFNDHADDYSEIVAVIRRAKELAQEAAQLPAVRAAAAPDQVRGRLLPAPPAAELLPPEPRWPASAPRPAPAVIDVMPMPAPRPIPTMPFAPPGGRGRRNLFWELLSD
jgi:hypothetical protein